VSAQPARRSSPGYLSAPPRRARRASAEAAERRRRERHRSRLRRDLLVDFGLAVLLTVAALIVTAGLGVIAILEVPVIGAVIASFGIERRRRVSAGPYGSRRRGGSSRR
jgi:hypothetical protein